MHIPNWEVFNSNDFSKIIFKSQRICVLAKELINFLGMPAKDQAGQKGVLKLGGAGDARARNAHRNNVLEDSEV